MNLDRFVRLQQIQEEGREFPILDAAGNLTDIMVRIYGPDSSHQRNATHAAQVELDSKRGFDGIAPEAAVEAYTVTRLKGCVGGWRGLEGLDGLPLEATPENVEQMLRKYPVFQDQVKLLASTRALFADSNKVNPAPAPHKTRRNRKQAK